MSDDSGLILSVLLKQINSYLNHLENRYSSNETNENIEFGTVRLTLDDIINNRGKARLIDASILNSIKCKLGERLDTLVYMLKENSLNLQYASEQLRDNADVVQLAVFYDPEAMQFASDRLKSDKTMAMFMAKLYRVDGLKYMHPWLKNDEQLALKLLKMNGYALKYLSDRIKDSRSFVNEALQTSPSLFFELPTKNKNDLTLAEIACERDYHCYKAVTKKIKENKPLALKMMHYCYKLYPYLSKTMQEDKDVIKAYKTELLKIENDNEYRELKTDVDAYLCANLFNTRLIYMKDKEEIEKFIKLYSIDKQQEQALNQIASELF